jgi:hypothetical protein
MVLSKVGRSCDRTHPFGRGGARQFDRSLHIRGPVVDAREQVAMQVDHERIVGTRDA